MSFIKNFGILLLLLLPIFSNSQAKSFSLAPIIFMLLEDELIRIENANCNFESYLAIGSVVTINADISVLDNEELDVVWELKTERTSLARGIGQFEEFTYIVSEDDFHFLDDFATLNFTLEVENHSRDKISLTFCEERFAGFDTTPPIGHNVYAYAAESGSAFGSFSAFDNFDNPPEIVILNGFSHGKVCFEGRRFEYVATEDGFVGLDQASFFLRDEAGNTSPTYQFYVDELDVRIVPYTITPIADMVISDESSGNPRLIHIPTLETPYTYRVCDDYGFALLDDPTGGSLTVETNGALYWYGDVEEDTSYNISLNYIRSNGGVSEESFELTVINSN